MRPAQTIRCVLTAAVVAVVCDVGGVSGALGVLLAGALALPLLPRRTAAPSAGPPEPSLAAWYVCTASFATTALLLLPIGGVPEIVLAMVMLSPMFGVMILVIESAIPRMFERART